MLDASHFLNSKRESRTKKTFWGAQKPPFPSSPKTTPKISSPEAVASGNELKKEILSDGERLNWVYKAIEVGVP
jgi:hypothetical protein